MLLKILSAGGPLWMYATSVTLVYGLARQWRRIDWIAVAPAVAGLLTSALFLSPVHRLFFDEDIYINVAMNLTHAPVNQVTVMGGPDHIEVSSYQKEPVGWPVLLSFAFLVAGPTEAVAFWFARLIFALAIAAVYQLARELLPTRRQALIAAILFGCTPICFWFSVSAGTDMTAVLMAVLGMWGLVTGNGALAVAGFAFAGQTRMELMALIPFVWLWPNLGAKWRIGATALILFEVVHVVWVLSVASVLEQAEEVSSAFGMAHVWSNFLDNLRYFFNPYRFPVMVSVFVVLSLWTRTAAAGRRIRNKGFYLTKEIAPVVWIVGLFTVYLCFYAGSFDLNPRYSI